MKTSNDTLELRNLVPNFLKFYDLAAPCDGETRFELWREHYGFAAVPPGEEGATLARKLLDGAWEKYAAVVPGLRQWSPDSGRVQKILTEIKTALGYDGPVDVVLVFFVGAFDGNAFVAPCGGGRVAVCLPVEEGEDDVKIAHELTHLVHGRITGSDMSWERSVASLIFQEGLATQLSRRIVPGHDDEVYVEHRAGWLRECDADATKILRGIAPHLGDCSGESVHRFTMGDGASGHEREGYYADWHLIGDMLNDGWSFADLARVAGDAMAVVLRKYI